MNIAQFLDLFDFPFCLNIADGITCLVSCCGMTEENKRMDDWALEWLKFRKGDRAAFQRIYDFFFDRLYQYGYKLTQQSDLLEDCIQELFLSLYVNRNNLSESVNLEFYLLKALKLTIYGKLRKESRFLDIADVSGFSFRSEFVAETEFGETQNDERIEKVKEYLEKLNPKSREILYLKFYTNLDYREIGEVLGIQSASVKKQVYRIMSKMKNVLGNQEL